MRFSLFLLLLFSLAACNSSSEPENTNNENAPKKSEYKVLPDSHGGTLDLIVVCDDKLWQGAPGEELRKHFTTQQYGLPQPEPRFQVNQINTREYNRLLERTRYQIMLSLDDTAVEVKSNVHAKNQLMAFISAPTELALAQVISKTQVELREAFREKDLKRLYKRLKPNLDFETSKRLEENHLKIGIPPGYDLEVEKENTLLFWNKTALVDKGILINFRPMPAQQTLMGENIIPVRDSLTKLYLQGEREGSYMVTETLLKPQLNAMEFEGMFAMEARGLWRMEGDIFGGPFLSYTIYDETHNQIITLDAFIFAPDQKKRNQLFELEAILKGAKLL